MLAALAVFSHDPVVTIARVVLLGLFGMATNPVLIGMAVRYAAQAPTLASALSTSSFNLGTAIGSWLAGFALESALGATGPVLVGTCIAALYFVPLTLLLRKERPSAPSSEDTAPTAPGNAPEKIAGLRGTGTS